AAGVEAFMAYYGAHLLDATRPYPGVEEALAALAARGVACSVLTNKPEAMSRAILEGLGLTARFVAVLGGDSLPVRKPDPAGLERLRALTATARERMLLVGDSGIDVGSVSLAMAAGGAAACHLGLRGGPFAGSTWLRVVAAGFEAATVGGFADWFAVTALFRHPLGLPIPHTAIIPARRAKIIEGIVTMVEEDWLSPDAISARLARLAPGALVVE